MSGMKVSSLKQNKIKIEKKKYEKKLISRNQTKFRVNNYQEGQFLMLQISFNSFLYQQNVHNITELI